MITVTTKIIGTVSSVSEVVEGKPILFTVRTESAEYSCKSYAKKVKGLASNGKLEGQIVSIQGKQEVEESEILLDVKSLTVIKATESVPEKDTVLLVGNVGKEPEMRYTPQGKAVTSFSLAVSIGWGDNRRTNWYNCIIWEKPAEQFKNIVGKGTKLVVEGTQVLKAWTDKSDNVRKSIEVTVTDYSITGGQKPKPESEPESEF